MRTPEHKEPCLFFSLFFVQALCSVVRVWVTPSFAKNPRVLISPWWNNTRQHAAWHQCMFKRLPQWTMCCRTARLDRISASPQRAQGKVTVAEVGIWASVFHLSFRKWTFYIWLLWATGLQNISNVTLAPKFSRSCFTQTHVLARLYWGLFEHQKNNVSLCLMKSLPTMTKTLCLQRQGAERQC